MNNIIFEDNEIETINNLDNFEECKRVTIYHHVRTASYNAFLKSKDKSIKENKKGVDEYSFRCQNLIVECMDSLCDYLWNPASSLCFNAEIATDQRHNPNFFVSKNPGEGTIWFTSETIAEQLQSVKEGNSWAAQRGFKIKFHAINGAKTKSRWAEKFAEGKIACEPDYHHVFITSNMAARSFSVPKIVNGVMLVNEPGMAPATQKFNRLATVDYDNPNKEGHMYWFNFNDIAATCPIYELAYKDALDKRGKKDQNGNEFRKLIDCYNILKPHNIIYVQCGDKKKEDQAKWTEKDLFEEINKNGFSHAALESFVFSDKKVLEIVDKMIAMLPDNFLTTKLAMITKSGQETINAGRTKEINKKESKDNNVSKQQVISAQFACKMIEMFLAHPEEDRNFENFYCDTYHLFSVDSFKIVKRNNFLEEIWEKCLKNM